MNEEARTGVCLFNTELEKNLIGSIIFHRGTDFIHLRDLISGECFYDRRNAHLFSVLEKRLDEGRSLSDLEMIASDMQKLKGEEDFTAVDLITLTADLPPLVDVDEYGRELKDLYLRRRLKNNFILLQQMAQDRTQDFTQVLSKSIDMLLDQGNRLASSAITLNDVCSLLGERIENNYQGKMEKGLLTGFRRLDQYGGMHRKDLITIGADSSQGKTALAINMLMNAVERSQAKALIFSMEMSAMQLGARILSPVIDCSASAIMYRQPNDIALASARNGLERLRRFGDCVFFGDDSKQTMQEICQQIRMHRITYGIDLVMIDYLQIITLPSNRDMTKADKLAEASRACKNIAKELDITVMLMSQINRDNLKTGNPEPTAGGMRGTGELNEASDLTILIYRPEVYGREYSHPFEDVDPKTTALLKIAKDRNGAYGGVGSFIVNFDKETTRFYEQP